MNRVVSSSHIDDRNDPVKHGSDLLSIEAFEFVFEQAPFASPHASTIAEMPDGSLLAAWFGGGAEGRDDVEIWVSRRRWPRTRSAAGAMSGGAAGCDAPESTPAPSGPRLQQDEHSNIPLEPSVFGQTRRGSSTRSTQPESDRCLSPVDRRRSKLAP